MGLQAGTNLFRYAENNPQVYFDSNGLSGCGPGNFWEYLVPDKPAGYDFLSACNRHDDCYRGDLGCDKTKKDCDDKFLTDMIRLCQGLPIPEVPERPMYKEPGAPGNQVHSKLQCRQTAMVYHFFVTIIGKSNFCSENREKLCGTNPYCHNRKQTHCEPDISR
jgi:hypothetical protein